MLMSDAGNFYTSHSFATVVIAMLLCSCSASISQSAHAVNSPYEVVEICGYFDGLTFNGTLANQSVQWQSGLGPRLPGSNASELFRNSVAENLTEWNVSMHEYTVDNLTFTNIEALLTPTVFDVDTQRVVLVAHYDTRNIAERDSDENRTNEPIIGANDGASGAAALLELARIIPAMSLEYEVELLWTDAEDQNYTPHRFFGAEAWAGEQSQQDIERTAAYIVLDMIGDADLQLTDIWPGDEALWSTISPLAQSLGMVENQTDCSGAMGVKIYDQNTSIGVFDDHVAAYNIGIPAIDLIDIRYGPNASAFGGYWHTHEDTPDKVSADSLATVGRLVELGLRSGAWMMTNATQDDIEEDNNSLDETLILDDEETSKNYSSKSIIVVSSIILLLLLKIYLRLSIWKKSS
ncbi:MAG: M28 family peptidase [Euryarchaeota archaeon]|nr:M28 family peptidase [Euryarchaeota archaeon]MBT7262950.1 M28 family peptidase [Euryarchaeota archaeon]MBT7638077.1 M28 family peptidase [Euryarchaeota archaeon]